MFLNSFRLPGEGQQIERILTKFSSWYCDQNPNCFANEDEAFLLAYSLLQLNMFKNNEKVKQDMSLQDFVKQCKFATKNHSLDFEEMYFDIEKNAFRTDVLDMEIAYERIRPFASLQQ